MVTIPSEMAQNLRVAEDGDITRYDASARNLVAKKSVLAYILKSALDEYAGYTPQEIAERFIEGEPEVRTMAVHQDHHFRAILPSSSGLADIYVNIEIQNNDTPGYPITKRGIYYASRMISSQRGDFKDQGYGEIKKVVSIWLCEDVAESRSGTINSCSIEERHLLGDYHEERRNYDLMSIVVMRLGKRARRAGMIGGEDASESYPRPF